MQWIKQPLLCVEDITCRQDLVEIFCNDTMLRQSLMDSLKKVPDLDRLAKKFFSMKAGLQVCRLKVCGLTQGRRVSDGTR